MGLFRFRVGAPEVPPDNLPPVWTVVPTLTVAYGTTTADVAQYVDDPEGGLMTYAKAGTWPSYLSLDTVTGVITATVNAPVSTVSELQVSATDGGGLSTTSDEFSVSIIKGTNRAPKWQTPLPAFTVTAGGSISAGAYASDLDADDIDFVPVPPTVLPAGFSLNEETGQISINAATTAGTYSFRLRATDGALTADSGNFVVTVNAIVSSPLTISQLENVKLDTVVPTAGYGVWNMGHFDKRGGFIMWGDSNHADEPGAHAVRYWNTSSSSYHGIAAGETGRLVVGTGNQATAKAADYDNLSWFYVTSEDKFFWTPDSPTGGDRGGIFDFSLNPPDWGWGNNDVNASQWPSGPYWHDYISSITSASVTYNFPTAYSEAADAAVALRGNTSSTLTNGLILVWDRNPNYQLTETKPWRRRSVTVGTATTAPWAPLRPWRSGPTGVTGSNYQCYTNSGVAAGVWFYFVRPDPWSVHSTYSDPKSLTFWRVNIMDLVRGTVPPQYEQLANHPEYHVYPYGEVPPYSDVSTDYNDPSNANLTAATYFEYWKSRGPLFVYDEDSNSIISVGSKVWVYDIDENQWVDKTPSGYKRGRGVLGGIKRNATNTSVREIFYRISAWYDYNRGEQVTNILGEVGSRQRNFHKLVLTGDKPRARFVPRTIRNNYRPGTPFSTGDNPWRGKHLRLLYSRKWNNANGTAGSGGYVFQFGGDYSHAIPFDNMAGYPPGIRYSYDSARQDCWRAKVEEVNGEVEMDMSSNFCAFYPYPGGPDPATTTLGPPGPDGVCVIVDKRGDFWVGPGYHRFRQEDDTVPSSTGPNWNAGFPVFRWRMPAEHTDGVRMGNGWYQPSQNYLLPSTMTKINADDIYVGSGIGSLFGVSNTWAAYDEKADEMVIMSRGSNASQGFYRFPLVPTAGRHTWTVTSVSRNTTAWYAFLNSQIPADQTPYSASSPPQELWGGGHVVIQDHLYVLYVVRGGAFAKRVEYIAKYNLRDITATPEYIGLPVPFLRGWDIPKDDGTYDSTTGSISEFRDIQRLGHLIVMSPAYESQKDSDAWLCWYNTNTGQWTIGQSYVEMAAKNPQLPAFSAFTLQKGAFCTVEETGEAWVNLSGSSTYNGIIKYRIL